MNIRLFSGDTGSTKQPYRLTSRMAATETTPSRQTAIPFPSQHRSGQEVLWRQQALTNAHQGRLDEAIALLTDVIQRNPTSADYNNRGLLHFQNGQPHDALADYDRALELNSRQAKVYNNRANCYAAMGYLAEAIADYETALDLDPANLHAWINQGITFRDLEMYPQAVENFDLALRFNQLLQSNSSPAQRELLEGHIFAERGRTHHLAGDWNWAVADYQRAILALPESPSTPGISIRLREQTCQWLEDLLQPVWN